ncbi:MAG TPA: glycosyl hydrolase family 5 [Ruminococcus sp.]|nr:glycosyl hydrolase family 5 [Ruminococcus sp.]
MLNLKEKGFYKGINLGGWFSQCDYSTERLNDFIKESDIAKVSGWGIDHVRIPVDYNILEREDGFKRLDEVFSICQKYHLHVVLDLHKTKGFSFDDYGEDEKGFFDNPDFQENFYQLWERIAQHYGVQHEEIAFELLNEITEKKYLPAWNRIVKECIRRIRLFAPKTLILVGSYWNNSAETVKELEKPYDENVIYNMHCYEPLKFTHQGAYWTSAIQPEKRYRFNESNITPEYFEELFSTAIQKAKENQTALYCGEYGVIDIVPAKDTLEWFKVIHSVFEKYGIGRCAWTYKDMDFSLSSPRLNSVHDEIVQNL